MTGNLWPDELKILVVDDEQEVLNLIRFSLEPAGFRVLRTTRPEEGLKMALREKPDLMLLDIMMPGLDGFELLRRVRRNPALTKIPAIIVSAWADGADKVRMLQISHNVDDTIDAYVGKPFDPAGLLHTVKEVLMTHRSFLLEKNQGLKPWERHKPLYL
jgi:DNA-binding response OmpR family regulator